MNILSNCLKTQIFNQKRTYYSQRKAVFGERMIAITAEQLYKRIEKLDESPLELLDEAEARELLQEFFDRSLAELPAEGISSAFSLLRKLNSGSPEQAKRIDFPDLISTLVFCFDLIYSQKGKRILFTPQTDEITVCAGPEKISLSFLNILFNLIECENAAYYFVSLRPLNGNAVIEIEFEESEKSGEPPFFNRLESDYIYSLGGRVLFSRGKESGKAVICIPQNTDSKLPEYLAPLAEDLLFDRLSVIYSSLF